MSHNGRSGQASSIGTLVSAVGGGRGGSIWGNGTNNNALPGSGGSGGGGIGNQTTGRTGAQGEPGQGSTGGDGVSGAWLSGGGGGATGSGGSATSSSGGSGGAGRTVRITGSDLALAGGGGGSHFAGSSHGTATAGGGNGGSNGVSATANTGGGGGGAGATNQTTASTGGAGGSGVVILSYGAGLEVTRTATSARVGSNFSQSIQVRAGNGSSEHDVTITATGQVLRVGNSGTAVTSVTVRTVSGVATFTDLGFTSNVGVGPRTLTCLLYTSDAADE